LVKALQDVVINNFGTWNLLVYIKDDQSKEKNAFKLNIEKRKDMHFVNMPWKESHQILGDNYNYSLKERLSSTMNNLHKNSDLLKEYTITFSMAVLSKRQAIHDSSYEVH